MPLKRQKGKKKKRPPKTRPQNMLAETRNQGNTKKRYNAKNNNKKIIKKKYKHTNTTKIILYNGLINTIPQFGYLIKRIK